MRASIRSLSFLFFCAVLLLCLAPGAGSAASNDGANFMRWKFATLAPKGIGWARHIESIVLPFVDRSTDGNMKVKVYWGGVMGDDEDYIRKMAIGQIQGAGLSGQGVVMVVPEMGVLELPFMFRSWDEVDYVKEHMQSTFDGLAAENGYFMVAWVDQDFDQLYSYEKPIRTPEDMKGKRLMVWYGPVEEELAKAVDAVPVPVNVPEAASATRQKIVDCALGPALWIVGAQVYQVYRYINPMKLRYSPAAIVVSMDAWNQLPAGYRDMMLEERPSMIKRFCTEVRKDNQKCLDAMYAYGVQEAKLSPDELAAFEKATRPVWNELSGKMFPRELLAELTDNLRSFRHNKGKGKSVTFASVMKAAKQPAAPPAVAASAPKPVAAPAPAPAEKAAELSGSGPMEAQAAARKERASGEKHGWAEVPLWSRVNRRDLVRQVQSKLKQAGYYDMAVDGLFGPRTFWGIKNYQRARGLAVTGMLDDNLLRSMQLL